MHSHYIIDLQQLTWKAVFKFSEHCTMYSSWAIWNFLYLFTHHNFKLICNGIRFSCILSSFCLFFYVTTIFEITPLVVFKLLQWLLFQAYHLFFYGKPIPQTSFCPSSFLSFFSKFYIFLSSLIGTRLTFPPNLLIFIISPRSRLMLEIFTSKANIKAVVLWRFEVNISFFFLLLWNLSNTQIKLPHTHGPIISSVDNLICCESVLLSSSVPILYEPLV